MTRSVLALTTALVLVLAACSTAASPSAGGGGGTGGTIKIGGGFALTGDESALDLPAANGAKLAVKEINAAGGVLGSRRSTSSSTTASTRWTSRPRRPSSSSSRTRSR